MRWSSCITRRWNCPHECRKGKTPAPRLEDLQKIEQALDQKEKALLKKERLLQRKIRKYNKHTDRKAKADLKAANKLNRARKRILLVLDSKDRLKKSKKKHKVAGGIKKRRDGKHKKKGNKGFLDWLTGYPVDCFTDLLNKPCYCDSGRLRRRVGVVEPSLLSRLCGGPCACPHSQGRKHTGSWKMLPMHMCRCESPQRERYGAGDCYLMSLRRTPQVWIHHRWPRFYPHYLDARHQWKNISFCLLLCAGILIWTPCILCLELCKCFCCACCSDY